MLRFLLCTALSFGCMAALPAASDDNKVMRRDADEFLANMPPNLQRIQADAVNRAIAGDCSALDSVRNSRNAAPPLSPNVVTRMLTPRLRLYEPREAEGRVTPALVYLHGGGWTFGSLNSCARFCEAVAATGLVRVVAVDYRLAPEHPFPAATEDCVASFRVLHESAGELHIDPDRISIGGDSSGGNLAIATALADSVGAESIVVFYPVVKAWTDGSQSWRDYGEGYGLDGALMEAFNRAYVGNSCDSRNPGISVACASDSALQRLPRMLMVAAGRDILRDQGLEFAARLGGRATRIEFPEAVHLFITVPGQNRAFERAVELTVSFLTGKSLRREQ